MPPAVKLNDIINSPLNKSKPEVSSKDFTSLLTSGGRTGEISPVVPATLRESLPDVIDIPDRPQPTGLKFHIEINTETSQGNSMHIRADAENMDDVDLIHERYREFMPRKKFLGLF